MPRERGRSRRGSRVRARASRLLIFGESENDTGAIKELSEALQPRLAGRVHTRRQPLVLIKNAKVEDVPGRAQKIVAAVRAEKVAGPVCGVLAHEDCDDQEPQDEAVAKKIETALSGLDVAVHAVVPAWELEAWWFLWPSAVVGVQASWRKPDDYVGKRVGLIPNAKAELKRRVVPRGKGARRPRPYTESDSRKIAAKVREMGVADEPEGQSASYDRFRDRMKRCAA